MITTATIAADDYRQRFSTGLAAEVLCGACPNFGCCWNCPPFEESPFEYQCETADFFKEVCVGDQLFGFLLAAGTHCIGAEFIDGLWGESQIKLPPGDLSR